MHRFGLMRTFASALVALALAACGASRPHPTAVVPPGKMADPARGEKLYATVCAGCHSTETHWQARHKVRDWATLTEQVTAWQQVAGQSWSSQEINDVAAYLNRRFYEVPCPLPRCAEGTVG